MVLARRGSASPRDRSWGRELLGRGEHKFLEAMTVRNLPRKLLVVASSAYSIAELFKSQ
jgi:hypothetical protein